MNSSQAMPVKDHIQCLAGMSDTNLLAASTQANVSMRSSRLQQYRFCWIFASALIVGAGCSSSNSDNGSTPTPPDNQSGAHINTFNYTSLLELIFMVANTETMGELPKTIATIYGDDISGVPDGLDFLTETSSSYDPETAVVRYDYACSEGGMYIFKGRGSSTGGGSGEFEACQINGAELNGSYSRVNTLIKFVYSIGFDSSTTYNEMTSSSTVVSDVASIEGTVDEFEGQHENKVRWDIPRFTGLTPAGETIVTDAGINFYVGDQPENPDFNDTWKRTFSGNFTIQAPQTGNSAITVSTDELFIARERTSTYASGILQVTGADGSEMRLVADNGDPDTFQVDITSNGTVSSFTLPWEGELRLRCLADPVAPDVLSDSCR